jgi:hypothetical protein
VLWLTSTAKSERMISLYVVVLIVLAVAGQSLRVLALRRKRKFDELGYSPLLRSTTMELNVDSTRAMELAHWVILAIKANQVAVDPSGSSLNGKLGANWRTWGQNLEVSTEPLTDGSCQMRVAAWPSRAKEILGTGGGAKAAVKSFLTVFIKAHPEVVISSLEQHGAGPRSAP